MLLVWWVQVCLTITKKNMKKYESLMTTLLKGHFSVMLKSPSLPVKNLNWWEANQLAIYQAWWICPWDLRGQIHSVVRVRDLNLGLSVFKPSTLTTEPHCLLKVLCQCVVTICQYSINTYKVFSTVWYKSISIFKLWNSLHFNTHTYVLTLVVKYSKISGPPF